MATTRNGSAVLRKPNSMARARKAHDGPVDLGLCSDGAGGWGVACNEPFNKNPKFGDTYSVTQMTIGYDTRSS